MSPRWNKEEGKPEEEKLETEASKPVPVGEPQINILRSEIDAFIADRFKSLPKSLEEVEARVVEKPQDGKNQMSLPDELKDYEKKFAFCWIYKKKKAVDEACDLYHWVLCNKTYFPDVAEKAPHIFTANGAIERGDNILAFRSKSVDEFMRKAPGIESNQLIQARKEAHVDDPAFYIPKSDEWETDPKTGKRTKVPIVGV